MKPRLLDLFCGAGGAARGCQEAMEMPWATKAEIAQAIPPSYTRFIGEQLISALHPSTTREKVG